MDIDDIRRKAELGPAYWLPVPLTYLQASGAVAAQWGIFEMQFVGCIRILSRRPDLAAIGAKIPGSFNEKAHLVRKLARLCFAECPSLSEKICDFSTRANQTCKKRNAIIHGFWFDDPVIAQVRLTTMPDGTGDFYTVELSQIEALARKIHDFRTEGMQLLFLPTDPPPEILTLEEVSALRDYHRNFPAPQQEAPIVRDPHRRGSPQQPERFQA